MAADALTSHEAIVSVRGERSGLPFNVAVHSTKLCPALGGCRLWSYPDWQAGLGDAMRLSAAMTLKRAVAGLPTGGGKSVICLEPGRCLTLDERRSAMLELGDVGESLGGTYSTAEDVGTSTSDKAVVRVHTRHVLDADAGGAGNPSARTARDVLAAIRAVLRVGTGTPRASGRTITISGLAHLGSLVARALAEDGADLIVTDLDPRKRNLATDLGARWVEPGKELLEPRDLVVPSGVSGVLTESVVANLKASMIAGPANSQVGYSAADRDLSRFGILWAPEFIANAGVAIHGILADAERRPPEEAAARIEAIEQTVATVLTHARDNDSTQLQAAVVLARATLATAATASRPSTPPNASPQPPARRCSSSRRL